jgi:hypothetical protein
MAVTVRNYPIDVTEQDGHYILFTIYETQAYEYNSPYTDVNVPQQKLNSAKLQTFGVSDSIRKKILENLNKVSNISNVTKTGLSVSDYEKRDRVTTFAGQFNAAKPKLAVGAISLYTPKQIKVTHKMSYSQEDMSAVFAGLKDAISGQSGSVTDAAKAALQRTLGSVGRFAGSGGAQQALFGTSINQNLAEVLFTGLEYRTFSFEYSFMPRNKKEAQTVDDIINMFTFYALPNRKQTSAMTFDIPAEFNMKYMYYGKENKYIHPALTLGLESIDITYGGEKFATFRGDERGAQPIRTDMTLTFRELEYADRYTMRNHFNGSKISGVGRDPDVGSNRENAIGSGNTFGLGATDGP